MYQKFYNWRSCTAFFFGLLMYAISHNDNGDAPYSISGTGIGGGCEYFLPGRSGGLYIGLLMELGSQTSLYYQDSNG